MSRAIRRQQQQQQATDAREAAAQRQPRGPRLTGPGGRPPSRGAAPTTRSRRFRMPRWADDIISELKKVTWPSRMETRDLTIMVIVVAVGAGFVLGGVDIFFNWLMDHLLLR
jgi:preprotein translocase SecE subunit